MGAGASIATDPTSILAQNSPRTMDARKENAGSRPRPEQLAVARPPRALDAAPPEVRREAVLDRLVVHRAPDVCDEKNAVRRAQRRLHYCVARRVVVVEAGRVDEPHARAELVRGRVLLQQRAHARLAHDREPRHRVPAVRRVQLRGQRLPRR